MKSMCYLIFTRKGVKGLTKGCPTLRSGEYAVRVVVEVPDSVFRPDMPLVNVEVRAPDVIAPTVTVQPSAALTPTEDTRRE